MTPVLAFLGCGSMNGSILRGVLASGVPVEQVRATVRSAGSARRLQEETAVSYTHLTLPTIYSV